MLVRAEAWDEGLKLEQDEWPRDRLKQRRPRAWWADKQTGPESPKKLIQTGLGAHRNRLSLVRTKGQVG